jgi:predicted acylesterase/phospholipase RssA
MDCCAFFRNLSNSAKWLLGRQPRPFSFSFVAILLIWFFFGFGILFLSFRQLVEHVFGAHEQNCRVIQLFHRDTHLLHWAHQCWRLFPIQLLYGLIVLALSWIAVFVTYNIAVLINRNFSKRRPSGVVPFSNVLPQRPPQSNNPGNDPGNALSDIKRIGIVLAGGGAKGAFQAGAMKAIYRFLAEQNALDKVKVISGTSIGSWNSLFWLADLIAPQVSEKGQPNPVRQNGAQSDGEEKDIVAARRSGNGPDPRRGRGAHEQWWRAINSKSMIAPACYMPFVRNSFLSSEPWRRQFWEIFKGDVAKQLEQNIGENQIHFYMTRCNVRTGALECATNNPDPPKMNRTRYDIIDAEDGDLMDRMETAVFASMDLPPLFPYFSYEGDLFEDGGVINNLPISFATNEKENCDLVFVLPLNANFEDEPREGSITARLSRIMDMRQGALERHEFKLLYLYDEIAKARGESRPESDQGEEIRHLAPEERAKRRRHKAASIVFAVCPQKAFVQSTINTRDLWNSRGAAIAFQEMYKATWRLLKEFDSKSEQRTRRVALISRGGEVNWADDF